MKYLIYIKDEEISEKIITVMSTIAPSAKGVVIKDVQECLGKGTAFDFAFIGDDDENVMWMDLMFNLAARGTGVYLVARQIDSQMIKFIKEASGLAAISISNLETEIKSVFVNIGDDQEPEKEDSSEIEFAPIDNTLTLKEFALVKARKYPAVIISIHGAKGGVGKTNIAANLAVLLAQKKLKTIVVDFDVENGNLMNVLHIVSDKDLKDVMKGNINYNDSSFEKHSSGLYVLPSLKTHVESELITGEISERIISRLAKSFDVIVIDTGTLSIDPMLMSMQLATKSYFVTTCDMTVMAKTYDLLGDAKIMGIELEKSKLILNRMPKKCPINKSYISEYINIPILADINEDEELVITINNGEVPIENNKCKKFNEGVKTIFADLIKDTELVVKIEQKKEESIPQKKGMHKK